ncbi:hypothetical protein EBT16_06495 [bacterium]|nr:hypothetical protein [bacterium]
MTQFTRFILIPLSLALVISCTKSKPLAMVGEQAITKDEVNLRLSMLKVFNPQMNENAALEQLIRSATIVEILKNKGITIDEKRVSEEMTRLQTAAKNNPQMEALLKNFGNKKSFKDMYVMPMVAEQLAFREAFQKDEAFHKAEKEKADMLFANAKANPSKLESFAKELGVPVRKGSFNEKEGLVWDASGRDVANMPPLPSGVGFGQMWKRNILDKAGSGKVSPQVESIGQWMVVVRNDGSSKNNTKFTAAFVTRKNFGEWFNQSRQMVKVTRMEGQQANAQTPQNPAPKAN